MLDLMKQDESHFKSADPHSVMKNEGTKDTDKPDKRKAYSTPRLKRLGTLSELSKNGRLPGKELQLLRS